MLAEAVLAGDAHECLATTGLGAAQKDSEVGVLDRSAVRKATKGQCSGKWNGMLIGVCERWFGRRILFDLDDVVGYANEGD